MRRVFLAVAVLVFLLQVGAWPVLGWPSARVWPPASLLLGLVVYPVLLETRGPRLARVAVVMALAFGALFPLLATKLTGLYGFGAAAWLPGIPLAWAAFLLLSLALADQLRWMVAGAAGRDPGARVGGVVLVAQELLWDPALLHEGALWCRAPSDAGWPLGYSPGFLVVHALIGWGFSRWIDRLQGAGRAGLFDGILGAGLLTGAGLIPLLLGAALPMPPSPSPGAWAAVWELLAGGGAALGAGLGLAGLLPRVLPREGGRVLLTTCPGPVRPYRGGHYPLDFYSSRSARGQGPWTGEVECPYLGGHLIGRNLRAPTVVLEYPGEAQLEEELREVPYDVVGVGFTVVSREAVRRVCQLIRRVRPEATIVLGGYGVVCLPPTQEGDLPFDGLVDEVCRGEGVGFMRRLLGEDEDAPRDLALPLQHMFPLGLRLVDEPMLPVVAGFGCDRRCGFCGTSAFFGGKNLPLAPDQEVARHIEAALAERPEVSVVALFDEDFLADRARLEAIAAELRRGGRVDPARIQLSVFATVASLAAWSAEELATLGVGYVWVGVESRFTNLRKVRGAEPEALLEALEDQGIGATVSWILGLDHQTPENLPEDLAWLVSLPSVTAQVSLLGPLPGTPLYRQLEARGRLIPRDWDRHHLYEECMVYEHFAPGELTPWVDRAYRALYLQRGPTLLRTAEVWRKGYRAHRDHDAPELRARGAHELRRLRELYPVLWALARVGETSAHRARAREVLGELGPEGWAGLARGIALCALVLAHRLVLAILGLPARQPRPTRSRYGESREEG